MPSPSTQPFLSLENQDVVRGFKEIRLTDEIKEKIRLHVTDTGLAEAERYAQLVDTGLFRYESNGHEVVGFIAAPKERKGKLPCIIYNRGGTGDFGSIKLFHVFAFLGRMASWGYVVIASQYSGNGGSEGKDEYGGSDLTDVLRLKDVLAQCPSADTHRIGMIGFSRGAIMAYRALTQVDWIHAAITVGGPTNLIRWSDWRPALKNVFEDCFGGSEAELRKRSAAFWADRFPHVPLLIMHGTADDRVQVQDSKDLSSELTSCGIEHNLMLFENGDHSLETHKAEKWKNIKDWFDRFLK